MQTLRVGVLILAVLSTASACAPVPGMQGPGAGPRAMQARGADKAAELVAGVKRLERKLATFSGVVRFWETDGQKVETNAAEVFLAAPGRIRANLTETANPLKRGAKLVYLGGQEVRVKLGFIKKTYRYDHPDVVSLNGYRIDQTDISAIVAGLTHPQAQVRYAGSATVDGRAAEVIEVTSPVLLPGVDREVVTLDAEHFVPVKLDALRASAPVFRMALSDWKLNPPLSDDLFKL